MPTRFDLIITAYSPSSTAEFRLLDASGAQLAFRQTNFKAIPAGRLQGLFDLRNFLRTYVDAGKEAAAVAEVGVCIAEEVLGQDIFARLWASESQRTLCIQLPGATEVANHLASALARVPWEIARPAAGSETLTERNLLVPVVHDMQAGVSPPVELAEGEPLRVLFVFAEARGSTPLGARQERQELLQLFEKEVYPRRGVVAHFLTHGVTRERLESQIQEHGGYHVVHWSGHGNLNLLELAKPGGASEHLSGEGLLDLFTNAGGFLPRLVFLSACHSGDILQVRDWNDFLAVAEGKEPGTNDASTKALDLAEKPGFTGTAHALLQGGVLSIVAMRYAVGDDYARELSVEFYRALLAHAQPKNATASLALARQAMLDGNKHDPARFVVCDHATPVLYGAEQPGLTLPKGRSAELTTRNVRLHRIAELTSAAHEHFVGRTWQLAELGAEFIGSSTGAEVKPVAVIAGLGGMGKTALVAEALALWETRFEWVLLYQAKPNALGFEATLRDIDLKLRGELGRYHKHVMAWHADAIYRDATADFTGPQRMERLTQNLLRALKDEPILIVFDNFETNLKPGVDGASTAAACQDPAWDNCLTALAEGLVGAPSRVLITCRRPLAVLADTVAHPVQLGPLPPPEAALYLKAHPVLSRMVFGADAGEKKLAVRLLNASRFHPLLMDRLARLASDDALQSQLLQALDTLEKTKDFAGLPALFATKPGDVKELAYLGDALATSLDQLIREASPDARRVLWIIALANDPVTLGLLKGVWSGESHEQEQLRRIKQMLDVLPTLPQELQEEFKAMSPELRATLDALSPEPQPELAPLLLRLVSVGLATEERAGPDDENPDVTCHELVRERIHGWMEQRPLDRGGLTENAIRLAYAERLETVFRTLQHQDMTTALEAGSRALVYCVQAQAWDRLGGFASSLITSTSDPRLSEALIPHLRIAAESAPEGQTRWSCFTYLADALRKGSHPEASLPLYEQAAAQARANAEAGGEGAQRAWSRLASITGNWALALSSLGELDASRQRHLDSAEAEAQGGSPPVYVISSELEALRIDIMQGRVAEALPYVEARVTQVEHWWQRHRSGEPVPEAPDAEFLARVFISALDVATHADAARQDWVSALRRVDAALEVERALERSPADIALSRVNRANLLLHIPGHFDEARAEMEACLELFENNPAASARTLSSIAKLFFQQGDSAQATTQARRALALREQLSDPEDRAISHHNLAIYLERQGTPLARAESPRHQLAALIYQVVAGLRRALLTSLNNYAFNFRHAHTAGSDLVVPRVADLLAQSAFHPLDEWLRQRRVDVAALQATVGQLLTQAREASEQDPQS